MKTKNIQKKGGIREKGENEKFGTAALIINTINFKLNSILNSNFLT